MVRRAATAQLEELLALRDRRAERLQAEARGQQEAAAREVEALRESVRALRRENDDLRRENEDAKEVIAATKGELETMRRRAARLERKLDAKERDHVSLAKKYETVKQSEQENIAALRLQMAQDMYIAKRLQ